MRYSVLICAAVGIAGLVLGCGGGKPSSATGRTVDVEVPNVRAKIVEPGPAYQDDQIGPAVPYIAEEYRIRTGDVIEIGVWGESDMTKRVTVGPDGRISYYMATSLLASGKTIGQLQSALVEKLKTYFKQPEVYISLENSAGNFVSVTGIVKSPGLYKITNESRLVDIIAQAGGIPLGTTSYGENFAEVADLSQAFVLRGDAFVPVDFQVLFGGRSSGPRDLAVNNVLLQPNDRIYVPSAVKLDNKVFVVGAVRNPQMVRFSKDITFLEALTRAGDVPEAAWERKAFIVRGRMNQPEIIPVNARQVRTGQVADITLKAGDVVFLPKTPLAKATEVISQLDTVFGGVTKAEAAFGVRFDRN
jgi:polysaccharide export outer membrane protein